MFVQDDDPNRVLLGPVVYFVGEHLIEQGDHELPILIRAQYLPNYLPQGLEFGQYMQVPNAAGLGAVDLPLNHREVVAEMDAANGWAPSVDVAVEGNDAAAPAPLPNNAGNANFANQARIPRPPNAFIGFRKDNHERVKAENPGIHNNDICKSPDISVKSVTNNYQPRSSATCGTKHLQRSALITSRRLLMRSLSMLDCTQTTSTSLESPLRRSVA